MYSFAPTDSIWGHPDFRAGLYNDTRIPMRALVDSENPPDFYDWPEKHADKPRIPKKTSVKSRSKSVRQKRQKDVRINNISTTSETDKGKPAVTMKNGDKNQKVEVSKSKEVTYCGSQDSSSNNGQYILNWINSCLGSKVTKIEELGKGTVYCQLMDLLFPNFIPLRRVNFQPKSENQFIQNFKILQDALNETGLDVVIPVRKLVACGFDNNLAFAQYFKRFFDANYQGPPYGDFDDRSGTVLASGAPVQFPPAAGIPLKIVNINREPYKERTFSNLLRPIRNTARVDRLLTELVDNKLNTKEVSREKDFYFRKLQKIEAFCQEEQGNPETSENIQSILKILYTTQDGFAPPTEAEGEQSDDLDED